MIKLCVLLNFVSLSFWASTVFWNLQNDKVIFIHIEYLWAAILLVIHLRIQIQAH